MVRFLDFEEGGFYHLYNRGVEGREIYLDSHDYARATLLLHLANSKIPVDIDDAFQKGLTFLDLWNTQHERRCAVGAWCLMPNHFHILVSETQSGGISAFMQVFATAYSMYFNARYKHRGRLMQGSYQCRPVKNDRHFQYLFDYIHLNPVKLIEGESQWKDAGIQNKIQAEQYLSTFPHSSLADYRNIRRPETTILQKELFPWRFSSVCDMDRSVVGWLETEKG